MMFPHFLDIPPMILLLTQNAKRNPAPFHNASRSSVAASQLLAHRLSRDSDVQTGVVVK